MDGGGDKFLKEVGPVQVYRMKSFIVFIVDYEPVAGPSSFFSRRIAKLGLPSEHCRMVFSRHARDCLK